MYYITINAKQITRYYINVVTRETKFHNNFHHFSMKCSNNIYASLYIIHTSVALTLCFTLLAILFNFLRGFFSFSILATLWDFFLKRNIRGFKISEFEVASLLTDIRNFTFQNFTKNDYNPLYRIISCSFHSPFFEYSFHFNIFQGECTNLQTNIPRGLLNREAGSPRDLRVQNVCTR